MDMDNEKLMKYYKRLLTRVEDVIYKSGTTDYDYLQIMFEAKASLVSKIKKFEEEMNS
jgi:hypothetical protein